MKFNIIISSLVMALTAPALADFVTASRVYELEPDLVHIPLSPVSSLRFSNCEGCRTISGQLTTSTRFRVDGKTVSFEDFCAAMRIARRSSQSGMFVQHHLESNEIGSVSVAR